MNRAALTLRPIRNAADYGQALKQAEAALKKAQ